MRGTRAKKIRKAVHQLMEAFPELIDPSQQTNFYRFAKRYWKQGKWKILKSELEQLSELE